MADVRNPWWDLTLLAALTAGTTPTTSSPRCYIRVWSDIPWSWPENTHRRFVQFRNASTSPITNLMLMRGYRTPRAVSNLPPNAASDIVQFDYQPGPYTLFSGRDTDVTLQFTKQGQDHEAPFILPYFGNSSITTVITLSDSDYRVDDVTNILFRTLEKGGLGTNTIGDYRSGPHVIRTASGWKGTNDVDFNRYMLVGMYMGIVGSDGYSVDVVGVQDLPSTRRVCFRFNNAWYSPQLAVMCNPYHWILLPQSPKPVEVTYSILDPTSPLALSWKEGEPWLPPY